MRRGFTLLELSVVLAIIAVVIGGTMSVLTAGVQQSQYNTTIANIGAIEKALLDYSTAFGRIPCPSDITLASTSVNYGFEAGYSAGGTGTGECRTGMTPAANYASASGVEEGGVPVRTLQLPDSYMYDGWGRRLRYAVDPTYTASLTYNKKTIPNNICYPSAKSITVNDATGTARTTAAIYAIISHGANGHGAFTASGAANVNSDILNTDELANCHCDSNGAHTGGAGVLSPPTYVQKAPAYQSGQSGKPLYYFDDIITFKEAWQMQASNNQAQSCNNSALWVADYNNHRVVELSLSGAVLMILGTSGVSGITDYKFKNPVGVTIDNSGNFWVIDSNNNRVMKYNAQGTWQMTIGGASADKCAGIASGASSCNPIPGQTGPCCPPDGTVCTCNWGGANGQFNFGGLPSQIAFDASGNLWVTDHGNTRIQEFNSVTGAYMSSFTPVGAGAYPSGLAIDKTGNFWVMMPGQPGTSNCSLYKCNGTPVTCAAVSAGCGTTVNTSQFYNDSSNSDYISIDQSGYIWVQDEGNGKVHKFNSAGTYVSGADLLVNLGTGIYIDARGTAWITSEGTNNLYNIDPNTSSVLQTIGTGSAGSSTNPIQFSSPQLSFGIYR